MSNFFKDWTQADVKRFNERAAQHTPISPAPSNEGGTASNATANCVITHTPLVRSETSQGSLSALGSNPAGSGGTETAQALHEVRSFPLGVPARNPLKVSLDEQKLNKLEKAWLSILRSRGYLQVKIQAQTLKLGNDCRYTPDFSALVREGEFYETVFWEVKGFMRDDARVKLLVAARMFPEYKFYLVTRSQGRWQETLINP